MRKEQVTFSYDVIDSAANLLPQDAELLEMARLAVPAAYAPYSRFRVAAAIRLANGKIITGTNQENASFPAGICAERVALSAACALYPGTAIESIAITFYKEGEEADHPVAPCGICRQSLVETENRFDRPIRLILAGSIGPVFILSSAADLLPLAFGSRELE